MKALLSLILGLSFASGLAAQTQQLSEKSIRQILLEGIQSRSPLGRFLKGEFSPGVKRFGVDPQCVEQDLLSIFSLQQPPMKVQLPELTDVFEDKTPNPRTRDLSIEVDTFESVIVRELNHQLSLFPDGDLFTKNRELCVDAVEFERPNAVSIGFGFLAFDPNLFFQLARDKNFNEWSIRAIIGHELAHQLQIWTTDPTLFKKKDGRAFIRDKELQADCVSSAILFEQSQSLPATVEDKEANINNALGLAFSSLGDFELAHYEGHHGTAWERALMVTVGAQKAAELSRESKFSSKEVLAACRSYIDAMNQKFGEELWPMGSRL